MSPLLQQRTSQRNTVTPLDVASVLWVFTHGLRALFYSPAPQLGVPVSQLRDQIRRRHHHVWDDVVMAVHAPLPPLLPLLPLLPRVACETAGQRSDPLSTSKCFTIHCSPLAVQCAHWRPTFERSVVPEISF